MRQVELLDSVYVYSFDFIEFRFILDYQCRANQLGNHLALF